MHMDILGEDHILLYGYIGHVKNIATFSFEGEKLFRRGKWYWPLVVPIPHHPASHLFDACFVNEKSISPCLDIILIHIGDIWSFIEKSSVGYRIHFYGGADLRTGILGTFDV